MVNGSFRPRLCKNATAAEKKTIVDVKIKCTLSGIREASEPITPFQREPHFSEIKSSLKETT